MAKSIEVDSDSPDKLSDVTPPGKTAARATSRPIIIGHGSMVKNDPMVVADDSEATEEASKAPIRTTEPRIEVPADLAEDMKTEEAEAQADDAAEESKPAEETDSSPDPEPSQENTPSSTGAVDTLMGEVSAKQADRQQKDELAAKTEEVEKSILAKEYFVPIKSEDRRRSTVRFSLALLILIVSSVVGLNFAVDAGMLDIGVSPLTDLL